MTISQINQQISKPTLVFISHVIPINPSSGQQQRVLTMIKEARKQYRVIFLSVCEKNKIKYMKENLDELVDKTILLPSIYSRNLFSKSWFTLLSYIFRFKTGLKKSNFLIGHIELTRDRISQALVDEECDVAIYEYWHAWDSAKYFKDKGIPVVLDMHDSLANAYRHQLDQNRYFPSRIKQRFLKQYLATEHRAWSTFDLVIALNSIELDEVKKASPQTKILNCPMGIDLIQWPYSYRPAEPVRFGFYGGLGSNVNHQQALFTLKKIMPEIWKEIPTAELWLIGSNPRQELQTAANENPKVKVTGFIEDPRPVLSSMSIVFCPWVGIFGFRSRIIELMALGVPVIASPDAIAGMGLTQGRGVFIANNEQEFSKIAFELVNEKCKSETASEQARLQIEQLFSVEATYEKLFDDIRSTML